ncbi:competence type IV pilus assembly protein ComGB [Ornithinibacillus contaminans]|uniref:competence type IV pilus assembly protein ComGB n=1 Tax=Ornithinibacillus contaminans TaxID=694055 RepID=UPI00064DB84F|nr:competence type IV pilus assembly protein ComGB [Ornithinibacillus contaminans]
MGLFPKIRMKIPDPRLPSSIQLHFLKRLASVLSSGYMLLDALETLTWDKATRSIADEISHHLKNGVTIDQAFELVRFNPLITSYLFFAKEYGDLEESITKCFEIYEERIKHMKKFTQVIRYPVILLVIFSIMFFFIEHTVLPNLLNVFQQSAQDPSNLTIFIHLISVFYYLCAGFLLLVLLIRLFWSAYKAKIPIPQQLKLFDVIPLFRNYIRLNTSYQFATHVSSLLKTGMPIKEVLAILSKQNKLPILSYYATMLTNGLNQGAPISHILTDFSFINPQLAAIFQKNNHVDSLVKDLAVYAAFTMEELNQKIIKSLTYLQPIFFIILGVVIVMVYLSIMWPMYQMIDTL